MAVVLTAFCVLCGDLQLRGCGGSHCSHDRLTTRRGRCSGCRTSHQRHIPAPRGAIPRLQWPRPTTSASIIGRMGGARLRCRSPTVAGAARWVSGGVA